MNQPSPYDLPIFRRAHRAKSPDGRWKAEIDPAFEVSMGNPTRGTLKLSSGHKLERCNPSFLWSDDSRFLAVPRFFNRFGLFRRQRLLVVDVQEGRVYASRETACYFQPDSFSDGDLVITKEPFRAGKRLLWRIPNELGDFDEIAFD